MDPVLGLEYFDTFALSEYYNKLDQEGHGQKVNFDPIGLNLDLDDACMRQSDIVASLAYTKKIKVYVSFRTKNVDYYIETNHHMTEQVVVTKFAMLLHRLFGHEMDEIVLSYRVGNCHKIARIGMASREYCMQSGHFGSPIQFKDAAIIGEAGQTSKKKIDLSVVQNVLTSVLGSRLTLEFPVHNVGFIQAKISRARNIIIKTQGYWELIDFNIIPSDNYVQAVIEASYAPGVGTTPPPEEAFKGNTEAEFPLETSSLLHRVVNSLVAAVGGE
jgi:hypothetical protein